MNSEDRINKEKPVIVIVGPTAVGKTELSISLAKKIQGEIISADSMQIYRGMDIGTAKPPKRVREEISHHMIDITNPDEEFSVAKFKDLAKAKLLEIKKRANIPIVVGGTGLYLNALIYDYSLEDIPRDLNTREKLREKVEEKGSQKLHEELSQLDPESAQKIHPNDVKRIIRALEVIYITGEAFSKYQQQTQKQNLSNTIMIGLTKNRDELYNKIEQRVDHMIEKGLVDEVKSLFEQGYDNSITSVQALGYKEIASYLQGEISIEESIRLIKKRTKRFAKRQLSWFKRDGNIYWYNLSKTNLYSVEKDILIMLQEYF